MLNVRKWIWCKTVRSAVKAAAVVIPYDKKTVAFIVVVLTVPSREYPQYFLLFGPLHKSTFSKIQHCFLLFRFQYSHTQYKL